MTVLVLGASGMLGSAVVQTFVERGHSVVGSLRPGVEAPKPSAYVAAHFDAAVDDPGALLEATDGVSWIINAIGVIKPHIDETDRGSVERAVLVNSLFPFRLATAAARRGVRVIQIATDCVYSGSRGVYVESDEHDPLDVYGKSKSLGEVRDPHVVHLRASIIGPEMDRSTSLLEWVKGQPLGAEISGFQNHLWNGVTTRAFARVCAGLVEEDGPLPHLLHLIPADQTSKFDLVSDIAHAFCRDDISVRRVDATTAINRTLATEEPALVHRLWDAAGYPSAPSVREMVYEAALWANSRSA